MKKAASWKNLDKRALFTRLIFILLAAFLWLLIQFSNTRHTAHITVPLELTDHPRDVLLRDVPGSVDYIIRAEGFYILQAQWQDPEPVRLSLAQLQQVDENTYFLTGASLRQSLGNWDNTNVEWVGTRPDTLWFSTSTLGRKRVPLHIQNRIEYRLSYGPYGPLELEPDSIWLFGANAELDTITVWELPSISARDLSTDQEWELEIPRHIEEITLGESSVRIRQQVRQYTEKWVAVPLKGDDDHPNLVTDTRELQVRCRVTLEDYPRIHGGLFDAGFQWNAKSKGEANVVWRHVPEYVKLLDWEPRYVKVIEGQ